jgi:hypothetical protein
MLVFFDLFSLIVSKFVLAGFALARIWWFCLCFCVFWFDFGG